MPWIWHSTFVPRIWYSPVIMWRWYSTCLHHMSTKHILNKICAYRGYSTGYASQGTRYRFLEINGDGRLVCSANCWMVGAQIRWIFWFIYIPVTPWKRFTNSFICVNSIYLFSLSVCYTQGVFNRPRASCLGSKPACRCLLICFLLDPGSPSPWPSVATDFHPKPSCWWSQSKQCEHCDHRKYWVPFLAVFSSLAPCGL